MCNYEFHSVRDDRIMHLIDATTNSQLTPAKCALKNSRCDAMSNEPTSNRNCRTVFTFVTFVCSFQVLRIYCFACLYDQPQRRFITFAWNDTQSQLRFCYNFVHSSAAQRKKNTINFTRSTTNVRIKWHTDERQRERQSQAKRKGKKEGTKCRGK